MTPAINALQRAKTTFKIHEYTHDAMAESYGLEAAEKLGISAEKVFKTLVVSLDTKAYAVGVIPVSSMLSMKQIAKITGVKKAVMANKSDVERITGYVLGGVSPIGQKRPLKTFIDSSALSFSTIFVSAGRRGMEIELDPKVLQSQTCAQFAEISQR